jgi:hypothetical protein
MVAATYNLTIDQGSDFAIELSLQEGGVSKDLTGYSARAQMRRTINSSTVAAEFTCTITDALNGALKMELSNSVSSGLTGGKYFYDLEIFTANDTLVKKLLKGEVILNPEVTR